MNNQPSPDYSFLEDSPLHQLFDFCAPSNSSPQIYICIYDINSNCKVIDYSQDKNGKEINVPFLKYAVIKGETQYDFPAFTFHCVENSDDNDIQVKNDALAHILDTFGLVPTNMPLAPSAPALETAFKGYVPLVSSAAEGGDGIMVVYDYSVIRTHFMRSPDGVLPQAKYVWAVVDELVFEKTIYGTPFNPLLSETLCRTPILWNIVSNGREIDFPFSLYSVKCDENGIWINERLPSTPEDIAMKKQSLVKIGEATDEYKYGDDYGDMYLFVSRPIHQATAEDVAAMARYAVFTSGAKYVLDETHHSALLQQREQLGGEIGASIMEAEETKDPETQTEEMDIHNMSVSSLYFVEHKLFATPLPCWGIRKISYFELV